MQKLRYSIIILLALSITACGRQLPDEYFRTNTDFVNTPEPTVVVEDTTPEDTGTDLVEDSETDAVETDETDVSETDTESTGSEEPVLVEAPLDPIVAQVANADPVNGEALTNSGMACTSCHLLDSEDMLVGPGLLNIPQRAENRIADQVAERYIFNSIIAPNDFVVEGFAPAMFPGYPDMYSEEQILDIVAYIMTLGEYPERELVFIEVGGATDSGESSSDTGESSSDTGETTSGSSSQNSETSAVSAPPAIDTLVAYGSVEQGSDLFASNCATCHSVDGNPADDQDDLMDIGTVDNAPSHIWVATFSEDVHPTLAEQYQQTISTTDTIDLIAYLLSLSE